MKHPLCVWKFKHVFADVCIFLSSCKRVAGAKTCVRACASVCGSVPEWSWVFTVAFLMPNITTWPCRAVSHTASIGLISHMDRGLVSVCCSGWNVQSHIWEVGGRGRGRRRGFLPLTSNLLKMDLQVWRDKGRMWSWKCLRPVTCNREERKGRQSQRSQ